MYDPAYYGKNKVLKTIIESTHSGATVCSELIRHSNYLRDDDYVPSIVGFLLPELIQSEKIQEDLLDIEHEIADECSSHKSNDTYRY